MKMAFPSGMPLWQQIELAQARKKVGRKHNKTVGPTRKKRSATDQRTSAAMRKYKAEMGLYFRGLRDSRPEDPREQKGGA